MKQWIALLVLMLVAGVSTQAQDRNISGSLTASSTGCSTAGSCVSLKKSADVGGISLQVNGTFSGTLQFEGSADGVTWLALTGQPFTSGTGVTSTTSTGGWQFATSGLVGFRVRCSSYSSGTASVVIQGGGPVALLPGGGSGGVTSITGTANQITASASTGAVTLSTAGPYTPATYASNGVLYGNGTGSIQATAAANNAVAVTSNTGVPSLAAPSANLQVSSSVLDTIQGIQTTSTPRFSALGINTAAGAAGTITTTGGVFVGAATTGIQNDGAQFPLALYAAGTTYFAFGVDGGGNAGLNLSNLSPLAWRNAGAAESGSRDLSLSRIASGGLGVGTGAQGSTAGYLQATRVIEAVDAIGIVGASATVTVTNGSIHTLTSTASTAMTLTPSSAGTAGQHLWLIITSDATGGDVVTFASTFKTTGTMTLTASKGHTIEFISDGTSWWEHGRTTGL